MMFRLLRPARRELREAAKYYEDRVPGLGFDFLQEVRAAIRRNLMHPAAWFALDEEIRRCRTHRFPYGLFYQVRSDEILIVSVMVLRRAPRRWEQYL